MPYKKAKHLEVGDYIEVSKGEHLWIRTIDHLEYTVRIYGFINGCTDSTIRQYAYLESVKVWERENPHKEKTLAKILKKLKKILSIS